MIKTKLKPSSRIVTTRCFETYLYNDCICVTIVLPESEIKIADAHENTKAVIEVSDGNIFPMIVDTRKIKSIEKEARDHFSMRNRKGQVSAIAILISSPVSVIIGNFFMGLNKPAVPTKLFKDEERALKWVKQFNK